MKDLTLGKKAKVQLLGLEGRNISWKNKNGNVVIKAPKIVPGQLPFEGPYVFRIQK